MIEASFGDFSPSYLTVRRNNPCGGAVAPAPDRSPDLRSSKNACGVLFPTPTSTSVPTIFRTIHRRNPLPSMVRIT